MILDQISSLDCVVFLILLAPQLLIHVGLFGTLSVAIQALPFLFVTLPSQFIKERYIISRPTRSSFVQQASPFEDFVIRCVRYAFAKIPAKVGRVFFSKDVALPFLHFRMLRHGYLSAPIYWREVSIPGQVKGLWVIHDELAEPDIIVYYAHGGGFSMGSSYFYLEFLLAWLSLLKTVAGYKNPAIFALEYTLVPDAAFPVQLQETVKGYEYVLSRLPNPTDASKVCVAGDSAGATLILTFLLYISRHDSSNDHSIANGTLDKINGNTDSHEHGSLNDTMHTIPVPKPGYATLISPWVSLVRSDNRDTPSDYLNASALEVYGSQYACGDTCKSLLIESVQSKLHNPLVSPFACKDPQWLRRSAPTHGYFITFGAEEVFAPSIASMVAQLRKAGVSVAVREEPGGIHAWPVASLFLSGNYGGNGRLDGLMRLARTVGENVR